MGLHEIYQFAIAVGLGLMVGVEREGTGSPIAGIRTFPLITAFGVLSGLLAQPLGPWVPAAGLVVVAAFMVLGNAQLARRGEPDPGMTTEYASAVMFTVGVVLAFGWNALAVAATGTVLVLLHSKRPLERFAGRLGSEDRRALAQLALVGFVLLPAMPDRSLGPFGVLNPREIWLMVVLIVGISLGAYVLYRLLGGSAGALLGGALGGLISSTASTLTFSRMSAGRPGTAASAAVMIVVASTLVFARVVGEVAVVARGALPAMAPPLLVMMAGMAGIVFVLHRRAGEALRAPPPDEPPSDLKSAVVFGALYAVILVAVAYARRHLGPEGLYLVSAVSGLTDMDAITLSAAQLVQRGQLEASTAWRMILVGGMANLVFKAGIVLSAGHRAIRRPVLAAFGASIVLGGVLLVLWPG
ncbi:MAG: MgtC/SapB family protein [Longimicrobiales bacterium]|nr:MgtC/SapB family protein [Longimicrobiales bacterium]